MSREAPVLLEEPWTAHRRRAETLLEEQPHAAEMLRLYPALAGAWTEVFGGLDGAPEPVDLAALASSRMMPAVLEATNLAGPAPVREAVAARFKEGDTTDLVRRWLAGEPMEPSEAYLARASTAPFLERWEQLARATGSKPVDSRHCPVCGGPPQLSFFGLSDDALVSAPRRLLCARCAATWTYPRMVCAGCGNEDTSKLPIYSDPDQFAHLRVDACEACRCYLVTVELPKQPAAVPAIDELVALPLELYARERGFRKITPNLMGF